MGLNKTTGNMYSFVTHTWNPIKGKCLHDCSYCYMKQFKQNDLHFDEKEMRVNLGARNFIFIGSSADMFADDIPGEWINRILNYCSIFNNKYLFQSKNPKRFLDFINLFPVFSTLGTTIETNRHYEKIMCNAPTTHERATYMSIIKGRKMVTIEPILDFDEKELLENIDLIDPSWINIGADSKGHHLPEPTAYQIKSLIKKLTTKGYDVKLKPNLSRLLK